MPETLFTVISGNVKTTIQLALSKGYGVHTMHREWGSWALDLNNVLPSEYMKATQEYNGYSTCLHIQIHGYSNTVSA